MARERKTKNYMWLDTSGMKMWIEKLDRASDNLEEIVETALTKTAEKIQEDITEAMQDRYLPAKGKYATGETKRTILKNQRVEWDGNTARIRVGFDETSEASKYLISGVWGHKEGDDDRGPVDAKGKKIARMKPDKKLQDIFWKKRYMQKRTKEMEIFFQNELARLMREALD